MTYLRKFYKQIFANLQCKNYFYIYHKEKFNYKDLNIFFLKFINVLLDFDKNKQKKICTLSNKSFSLYSCIISILLSNNIWVPLSTNLPIDRLKKILLIINPDIIFCEKKHLDILKKIGVDKLNIKVIDINSIYKEPEYRDTKEIKKIVSSHKNDDFAMIFFTSGSTGEPKGVPIKQKNFLPSFFSQYNNIYKSENNLIYGDFHDISFVISLNILLPCVYTKSAIVPSISNNDFFKPLSHIKKNQINVLITVPSFINQIKNFSLDKIKNAKLKILILCGETFYLQTLEFIYSKFNVKNIYNCYGSTELSPWVFMHRCKKSDLISFKKYGLVPIGNKFDFALSVIKNKELRISGRSVVDGYLNSKLNKSKFSSFDGNRWYRTGDLVKIINRKYLIYGRKDSLIKIRGYRVELLDIDTKIRLLKEVKNCIVFALDFKNYKKKIFAAIESSSLKETKNITDHLNKYLPNYMIPDRVVFYKRFPLNKNGKIDRKIIIDQCKKTNL